MTAERSSAGRGDERRRRRWWIPVTATALALLLALAALHTPPVRHLVRVSIEDRLARAGIDVRIGELRYSLLGLDVELGDLRLQAAGAAEPFLVAGRLYVDLPWSVLTGDLSIEAVEVEDASVRLLRDTGGRWNLPPTEAPATPEAPAAANLPIIGRMEIQRLRLRLEDESAGIGVLLPSLSLSAEDLGAGGRLRLAAPGVLRAGGQETAIEELTGRIAWNGTAVGLGDLTARTSGARLTLDGSITHITSEPAWAVDVDAEAEIGPTLAFLGIDAAATGAVRGTGRIEGPLAAPAAAGDVTSGRIVWNGLELTRLATRVRASPSGLTVDSLEVGLAGARVSGHGELRYGDADLPGSIALEVGGLDVDTLVTALGPSAGHAGWPRLAPALDAGLEASWTTWPGADLENLTADLRVTTRERPEAPGLPLAGDVEVAVDGPAWRLRSALRLGDALAVDARLEGRVGSPVSASTLGGTVVATAPDLSRLPAALEEVAGPLPEMAGTARTELTLERTLGNPGYRGPVDLRDLRVGPAAAERLAGTLSGSDDRIGLEDLRITAGTGQITGNARVDLGSGELDGRFRASLPRLEALLPDLPADAVPRGAVLAEGSLGGSLESPRLEMTARSEALRLAGQPPFRAEARAVLADATLRLDELVARQRRDLAVRDAEAGPDPVDEQAEGGLAACRGEDPGAGCLRVAATWKIGPAELDFRASGTGLELAPPVIAGNETPLSGTLDVEAAGGIGDDGPHGTATLMATSLDAYGRALGAATLRLSGAGDAVEVAATVPELGTTLDGRLSRHGPWELRADLEELPLERLFVAPGPEGRGLLTATVEAAGDLTAEHLSRASLHLRALEGTLAGVPLRLLEPGTVELRPAAVRTDGLELGVGNVSIGLEGSYPAGEEALVVSLSGEVDDLEALLTLAGASVATPPGRDPGRDVGPLPAGRDVAGRAVGPVAGAEIDLAGSIDARLELRGTVDDPQATGRLSLRRGELALAGSPPFRNIELELGLEEGVMALETLSATWQQVPLDASGRLPLGILGEARDLPGFLANLSLPSGRASLEARAGPLTMEALRPFLPAEVVDLADGRVVAAATLTADAVRLEAVRGEIVLEEANATVAGARLTQREPTRLVLADGRLTVAELRWAGAGTELRVTGSAPLSSDGALDMQARGDVDLRILQLLLPGTSTDGTGVLALDVAGTPGDPRMAGSIEVRDAELRVPAARLIVRGARGRIVLDGQTLAIEPLAGELNGGAFVLDGTIPFPDPTGGRIDLRAVDVAVQPAEGLRSLLDLDLVVDLADGPPGLLSGTVTITRGSYRERMSLVGQVLDRVRGVGEIGGGTPGALDDLRLDLRITTAESVLVDNNLAELALTADLQLTGTVGAPGLTGRAELVPGGRVFLSGNRFRVESGTVDFTSVRAIEPEFDLSARTRVGGYELTLRISGTPEEPEIEMSSDPALAQPDIASLLLTGRRLGSAESAQAAVAQEQLLSLVASEFTGRLARTVGLDSVRLERGPVQESFRSYPSMIATETDPTQRLTLSKELRPGLELVFSQALGESGGVTWLANYEVLRGFEIQALFGDDNDRAYQLGQQLTFGGGEAPARLVRRDDGPRVGAVVVEGDSPLAEDEMRDVLELERGDRFDFFRWQEDRERLLELHRRRGHLEARVDTTRTAPPEPAGSVRLTYTVDAGPRTVVTARGIDLTDELRRSIEQAWARSVLDDFLLQEAAQATRLHLAARGFVAPTVEASIDPRAAPGEKRLVVEVEPGPLAADRRVEVTGNQRLPTERIRAVIDSLEPPETAWARPGAAGDALAAAYAREGMPEARIDVDPPVLRDDVAVLRVQIDEGPRYRVGDLTFAGLEGIPSAEAEAALGLTPGDPYVPSRISGARRALEALLRTRGYSRAVVEAEVPGSEATDEPPGNAAEIDVAVTFRVDEGPLETLASIEVRGAEVTHPGIIDRALGLSAGDPVDREVLARARKRLHDTGAFRRVEVTVEPTGPAEDGRLPVRLVVSVGERPPYRFRYGVRLNSTAPLEETASRDYKLGLSGDLTSDNLLGRTISAGVSARYQPDFRAARAFVTTPRLFGLPLISSAFVLRSRESSGDEDILPFLTDVTSLTLEQRFSPFDDTQVAYGYSFERNHTFAQNLDPDDPFAFDLTVDISRLTTSGVVDTRDDPFDATAGFFHSSQLEYAATALGSDIAFAKYLLQQYYYRPLGPLTLASAARFGVAAAFDDQELIPSERFFAGGGNSVRGYAEDSLGPTGFLGDPAGGNTLLELKQEVRFPIAWRFRGVGFVDAGNVFETLGDLSLGDLKVGTGVGLRIDTPVALVRIDYGLALSRDPGDPRGRFFFSIGQAF